MCLVDEDDGADRRVKKINGRKEGFKWRRMKQEGAEHGIIGRFKSNKEGKNEAFQGVATSRPCLKLKKMREAER